MNLALQGGGVTYPVKVKAKNVTSRTFLFGSASVDRRFDGKFILVLRIDTDGEPVRIMALGPGSPFKVCDLGRGEVFALQIFNLAAVWAEEAESDTRVHCALLPESVA